jgi:hypothetical protein
MNRARSRLVLAAGLLVLTGLTGFTGATPAPADVGDPTESAVTVKGTGEFANLEVSVNQTKNLINQTIKVEWKGAAPTPAGTIKNNFLQIMQCWGDDPGPDRAQCQFGALPSDNTFNLNSRQLLNAHIADPEEKGEVDPTSPDSFVPYWVPGQPKPDKLTGPLTSEFLDAQISNEVDQPRTRPNGTGQEFFELQTFRENAGLDCGQSVRTGDAVTGKSCWLVIVPRGDTEVDGSHPGQLESSPLSKTNWAKRIQIKLEFLPVTQACQLGAAEVPVRGHETAVEVVSRWQPALCANNGPVFTYTQYSDELARGALTSPSPALEVLTNPLPPDRAPPGREIVYAPIALSGFAIAFNIEYAPFVGHVNDQAGSRFNRLRLTPRVVAKLLTQSYKDAVANQDEKKFLGNNPLALTRDPDFLKDNPEYEFQDGANRIPEPIEFFSNADVVSVLWQWVLGDAEARDFLSGKPDTWGMVINPKNKAVVTEPVPVFPRSDESCEELQIPFTSIKVKSCTGDQHPVAGDMHESGRSAGRGDIFSRVPTGIVNGSDPPIVQYSRPGRAGPGTRAVLAVIDTATAARYGLPRAELRNAAGVFQAPTQKSMEAGLAAMKPSAVPGVLAPDPRSTNRDAYPLTTLSYAATQPAAIDKAAGEAYAQFLNYAVGPGQESGVHIGQLPDGYVPLPQNLRDQTAAAAAKIKATAGIVPPPPPAENPGPTPEAPAGPVDGGSVPAGGVGSGAGGAGPAAPAAGPAAPGPAPKAPPGPGASVVTAAQPTPAIPAPAVWTLVVALLVCGALAGSLSPLAHYLSNRRAEGGR